jgi:O-antigen/teichoic acid export membrane protein
MALGRAVLQNTLWLVSAQGLASALALLQAVLLVRYLGREAYGVWSVATAWPAVLFVLSDLGLNSYVLREVAADRSRLGFYFLNTLAIKVVLALLFLASVWAAAQLLGYEPRLSYYISLAAAVQALACFEMLFTALFRALQRFAYETLINGAKALGVLGVALGVIQAGLGIRELLLGSLIVEAGLVAVCFTLLRRHWRPRREPWLGLVGSLRLIRRASPFALLTFVVPVFYQIDIIMLSRLATMEAVGIYSAAYKIVLSLLVIPRAFKNALFPAMSRLFAGSRIEFAAAFRFACKMMALVGFPLAFLIFAQAERIVAFLYADRFAASVLPLQVMAFCLLFTYLYSATQAALDASHNEARSALVWLAATLLNVGADLVLIPRYGYVGSSFATLLSEATVFAGGYFVLRRRLSLRVEAPMLARVGGVAALTALAVSWLGPGLIVVGAAAAFIYPALVLASGLLSRQELKAILARGE